MQNKSPLERAKQIDNQVSRLFRRFDFNKLESKQKNIISKLRQELFDARSYARDYELSETREEQLDNAKQAKQYLEKASHNIIKASEFDVFGPADVAHLSAEVEQLIADLK